MPPSAELVPGPLSRFSAPVRSWFTDRFPAPTVAQSEGWPAIADGDHTLILAPTGSGKTLAAFLWGIDRLATSPVPAGRTHRTRLVYVSPMRALAVDVEKNLRAPLRGIAAAAEELGEDVHVPTVGIRTGDTPSDQRRRLQRQPPDLLITTPESLYLMLTSAARDTLAGVEAVIVDEIHALVPTKRGAHLSLSLERLEELTDRPVQRIGLSATQRPLAEVARFLGGHGAGGEARPVTVVDAGVRKALEIEVVVPREALPPERTTGTGHPPPGDAPVAAGGQVLGAPGRSAWPAIHARLLELIQEHRSTIVFVNARRQAERLAAHLNELAAEEAHEPRGDEDRGGEAPPELVKAHHGSLSRTRRQQIEEELKQGQLRGLVATSTLELGIDMGAVDLVVQVESPGSVSAGLQRIGRAGHHVGEPSRGKVFPKHRADLVEAAVVVDRMRQGLVEATHRSRHPLDVLAQQLVAMCALDDWPLDRLAAVVRRSACYAGLSDDLFHAVVDMLAGRYPSDELAELRPRLVWDRVAGTVRGRAGAQRLAVTSGGTIPDRGLYGVFLPDGTRVGELDEEMVYESRPGDAFLLGASTWRIQEITTDRVVVVPAPGEPGRMPFWRGDGPGRPLELGRALGAFVRDVRSLSPDGARRRLRHVHALDDAAVDELLGYLAEQAASTGVVPDDRTVVVERFRDELGDWRVCVLSPFGARVHAPWAMAIQARLAERHAWRVEVVWSDDGIVVRLPEAVDAVPLDVLALDPAEVADVVIAQLPSTALFAARFRECAARALLLPRRRPDRRTPLWQQRQRAADLLAVAADHPDFPILLEATRECVEDVFDLPALREVLADVQAGRVEMVAVDTPRASPFAQSLLFGWIAAYLYEGDAPLAERRAAALALDRDLLAELLGAEELRDLIDPVVLAALEAERQRLTDGRRARDADELHDVLRTLGPLALAELAARADAAPGEVDRWVNRLVAEHRAFVAPIAGGARVAAAEDAARLRDALEVGLPAGLPEAFTEPVADPGRDLVARFARTHGPFLAEAVVAAVGLAPSVVDAALHALEADGRVARGDFRPGGVEREWCDADVLRQLRRRSLAALRREVEPVGGPALARFLTRWQGVGADRHGIDAVVEAVGQLQGAAVPASVLEADVLAARLEGYQPADLDALCTSGDVVWVGAGALGTDDGRVRLLFRDQAGLLVPLGAEATAQAAAGDGDRAGDQFAPGEDASGEAPPALDDELHHRLRAHLAERGASFWTELVASASGPDGPADPAAVLTALWDLVWAGDVTNDSLAPVRAWVAGGGRPVPARAPGADAGRALGGRPGSAARGARAVRDLGRRPRLGRAALSRAGVARGGASAGLGYGTVPAAAAGRWSLVAPLLEPRPAPTAMAHAQALQLLERHGVVTREAALAEGVEGGFAAVYPVLKALEERGQVRRGYFVAGLGAAQFALPGAVDRLRAVRDPAPAGSAAAPGAAATVLAATDPAQPYGAVLPWPEAASRVGRVAGAHVVLVDGEAVAYLERGGRSLVTFEAAHRHPGWAAGLAALVEGGRLRRLEVARIDGEPAHRSPSAAALLAAGFTSGYRGLILPP